MLEDEELLASAVGSKDWKPMNDDTLAPSSESEIRYKYNIAYTYLFKLTK
jgi:hypothetical protein